MKKTVLLLLGIVFFVSFISCESGINEVRFINNSSYDVFVEPVGEYEFTIISGQEYILRTYQFAVSYNYTPEDTVEDSIGPSSVVFTDKIIE